MIVREKLQDIQDVKIVFSFQEFISFIQLNTLTNLYLPIHYNNLVNNDKQKSQNDRKLLAK